MRMIATIRVESDDGKAGHESVSSVGVDTRLPGIDPDSAKEDFIAQARGLLTAVGETHVPALYAEVQRQLDCRERDMGDVQPNAGTPSMARVKERLQQMRDRKAAGEEQTPADEPEVQG